MDYPALPVRVIFQKPGTVEIFLAATICMMTRLQFLSVWFCPYYPEGREGIAYLVHAYICQAQLTIRSHHQITTLPHIIRYHQNCRTHVTDFATHTLGVCWDKGSARVYMKTFFYSSARRYRWNYIVSEYIASSFFTLDSFSDRKDMIVSTGRLFSSGFHSDLPGLQILVTTTGRMHPYVG